MHRRHSEALLPPPATAARTPRLLLAVCYTCLHLCVCLPALLLTSTKKQLPTAAASQTCPSQDQAHGQAPPPGPLPHQVGDSQPGRRGGVVAHAAWQGQRGGQCRCTTLFGYGPASDGLKLTCTASQSYTWLHRRQSEGPLLPPLPPQPSLASPPAGKGRHQSRAARHTQSCQAHPRAWPAAAPGAAPARRWWRHRRWPQPQWRRGYRTPPP